MKVVCISGRARHGKDTVASMMQRCLWGYGAKVLIIHNADLLKFMCKRFFHWDGQKDDRGRTLLQYVGTDVVRTQKPDFWVSFVADVLELFPNEWDYVLIPDCRFPNEINVLRDRGFDVLHVSVVRPDCDGGLSEEQRNHPSETAMDGTPADITIMNDGNLSGLTKSVIELIMPMYEAEELKKNGYEYAKSIA